MTALILKFEKPIIIKKGDQVQKFAFGFPLIEIDQIAKENGCKIKRLGQGKFDWIPKGAA